MVHPVVTHAAVNGGSKARISGQCKASLGGSYYLYIGELPFSYQSPSANSPLVGYLTLQAKAIFQTIYW